MQNRNKIRVGIVGANPSRGFASIAHIPALQALPDFEISAVCTTRQDSADAAAKHFGVPLAFSDAEKLARDPAVDLVTVSVKVPDHYLPVMAAIETGKHVYCEWPLGRNTDEAIRMHDAATRRGTCRRVARPGVPGDQLHQGPNRRRLCRPRSVGDDGWLCPELGNRPSTVPTRPTAPMAPTSLRSLAAIRSMRCAIALANFASLPLSS